MRNRKRVVAAVAVVCAAYMAWPYLTLFRLAEALQHGDAATLEAMVDWDGVREGIKEDICDTVFDEPGADVTRADSHLPPFGYSFVRGIAANAVDEQVSAEGLVSASRAARRVKPAGSPESEASPSLAWAFFDRANAFSVLLRMPGAAKHQLVRLQLELQGGGWKVTRVWLPSTMLAQANART